MTTRVITPNIIRIERILKYLKPDKSFLIAKGETTKVCNITYIGLYFQKFSSSFIENNLFKASQIKFDTFERENL